MMRDNRETQASGPEVAAWPTAPVIRHVVSLDYETYHGAQRPLSFSSTPDPWYAEWLAPRLPDPLPALALWLPVAYHKEQRDIQTFYDGFTGFLGFRNLILQNRSPGFYVQDTHEDV